ncbi:response regulator transcription factor [Candidatus Magnetaquicoccus inordinatus]|uniref:response regulator transcription factor n=1 Tax=Candidatus Magnetaquicoccus inordinatus TaxID=2496818 RepID=UPI00102B85F9|nr:response regulator transcription factor [Candidatus Magnetaquicoccus inordinatus]
MRLLLVEDDHTLADTLQHNLARAGFAVDCCADGNEAEYLGDEEPYDAIILDLGLPGQPGLEVLKNWRKKNNNVPVLILTAWDAWHERVDGFKAGADDYLGKPFHVEELLARLNALIRRSQDRPQQAIQIDGVLLNEERQSLILPSGEEKNLTGTEFRLLRYFMHHPDKPLSKSRLTEHVYEYDADKESNVIEVYVKRLRQLLGQERIETRRGQGYLFRSKV